jgi:tetracycline resistance efflux pump
MQMVPMNFYVWAALGLVFISVLKNVNLGSMKSHEDRALNEGQVFDPGKPVPGELKEDLPTSRTGTIGDLIWPILALFVGTVGAMLWTGAEATEGATTILKIFENTDVTLSLILGGLSGFVVSMLMFVRQALVLRGVEANVLGKGIVAGLKSMLPAVYILLFAWSIGDLIGRLETGTYLAGVVQNANLNISYLPFILFILAGFMAFATGTSWGSFGILLPIAGEIAAVSDITLILPAMAAVLGGAVFGDHCSPISDTTILSSTGAGSNHIDHVMTQLPYALLSAGIASIGFIIIGFTGSTLIALVAVIVLLVATWFILGKSPKEARSLEENVIQ